ncbi:MAG TPA: aspartate aminotransferase family protein [Chloroflexota bacterium]|jgi:glutamate-1-semialdehyde 2,1-aminomutase|nr:aspartate aminotransferase family protein [Chloroflexota bacterium]
MAPVTAQTSIRLDKSQKLFQEIATYVAGGESNYVRVKNGLEMCFDRGEGARFWDVDGNSFIDYSLGYGPLIFGHKPKEVTDAVIDVITQRGIQFTFPYDLEADVGRMIVEAVPGVDLVRFCTTGTEAVSAALRLARAFTGRDKIVKFEGHYHGWTDTMFVSVHPSLHNAGGPNRPTALAGSAGTPQAAVDLIIPLPWNDPDAVERTLSERGHEIAAVLTEPIMCNCGVIPPQPGYFEALREITKRHGVLLIIDEVKTGFRLGLGGAVEHYHIPADIVTWAKALGAGYPVAAFGGTREVMALEANNEVMHGGTYNAHSIAMAAAKRTLEIMRDDADVFAGMWRRGERLRHGLEEAARSAGHDAVCQGVGPLLQLYFTDGAPTITDYRSAVLHVNTAKFSEFQGGLQDRGFYIHPDPLECFYMSTAHTDADVEDTIAAARETAKAIAR